MKKFRSLLYTITFFIMFIPSFVFASTSIKSSMLVNNAAIIQTGAIVNDGSKTNNLNIIIIGMVVVILILVGAVMFTPKK